jgi:hypothetical protein
MLVVGASGEPAILVGNECYGMAGAAALAMRRHLFWDFSLPGQPRDRSQTLTEILAAEGIRDDRRVGVIQPGMRECEAIKLLEWNGMPLSCHLNPGHQIHLDEWVNAPVAPRSGIEFRAGMAMQVDVIPATGIDYFTTNIEDGVALADQTLRARSSPRGTQRPGSGSRHVDDSWATPSAG